MTELSIPRVSGRNQRRPVAFWVSMIEEFSKSDCSLVSFCSQKGISRVTFHHWRQRLKENPPQGSGRDPKFLPVHVVTPERSQEKEGSSFKSSPEESSDFTLHLGGHLRLKIEPGFHGPTLRRIVQVLSSEESSSCF